MRILKVNNSIYQTPEMSGSASHNYFLKKSFESLGHVISDYGISTPKQNGKSSLAAQRNVYRFVKSLAPKLVTDFIRDFYSIYSDRPLGKLLRMKIIAENPDFVYERFSDFHNGAKIAKDLGIPHVLEIHATPEERWIYQRANFQDRYKKTLLAAAYDTDIVVVVSNYIKRYLSLNGIDQDKILVIPNAVDTTVFCPKGKDEYIRREFGLKNNIVVGFIGTMQPFHGIQMLPEVCSLVKHKINNIKFLLVGNIRNECLKQEFNNSAKQFNVEASFIFTGYVPFDKVSDYIESMDICIMPDSNEYGSPIKLFEYGALGKPCLFPAYEPIMEILQDGVNGCLFKPKEKADLAEKIIMLAGDTTLRIKLGSTLYEEVLQNHTWVSRVKSILEKLLIIRPDLKLKM